MTTALLMMTLVLNTANVGLSSEAAARRLVGVDAPVAQGQQVSRVQLLDERSELINSRPTLVAPAVMLGFSTVMGVGAGLLWYAFASLGGLGSSGWEFILFTLPVLIFAAVLTGGSVALGAVGSWLLAKRIRELDAADARIGAIDEQLRRDWPQSPPVRAR
jgi:hypothetical protein